MLLIGILDLLCEGPSFETASRLRETTRKDYRLLGAISPSMRCSSYGSENREGRKFCAACDAALDLACAACGARTIDEHAT